LVGAFHNSSFVPRAMNQLWAKPKIIANFRMIGKCRRYECFFEPL
jgi:hypothetical protein